MNRTVTVAALATAGLAATIVPVLTASPAEAHHTNLTIVVPCEGSVTWSLDNSESFAGSQGPANTNATVGYQGASSTAPPYPNGTRLIRSGFTGDPKIALAPFAPALVGTTVRVPVRWDNGVTQTSEAVYPALPTDCATPTPTPTPSVPTEPPTTATPTPEPPPTTVPPTVPPTEPPSRKHRRPLIAIAGNCTFGTAWIINQKSDYGIWAKVTRFAHGKAERKVFWFKAGPRSNNHRDFGVVPGQQFRIDVPRFDLTANGHAQRKCNPSQGS